LQASPLAQADTFGDPVLKNYTHTVRLPCVNNELLIPFPRRAG
jgi:hypothetical protein